MKKNLFIGFIGLLCFCLSAQAQTDTTKYDLGRVQVSKNLTQSITIKGADLEKMPFGNLSEAINVWLYGVYGSTATYIPVVDGVTMSDINTLSIYDIDEITLVQNAATALNGASPQQLLLLIKTKRNHDGKKYGFEAAGQTNVMALRVTPAPAGASYTAKSTTQFYNQYYLSGYVNTDKIHAGISADYQRDGAPVEKDQPKNGGSATNLGTDILLNRYKFNGYLDAGIGKSVLSINAGYMPQTGNDNFTIGTTNVYEIGQEKLKDNLYYANLSLKSAFSGFQNTLTGSYEHYNGTNNGNLLGQEYSNYGSQAFQANRDIGLNASNYVIKDDLGRKFKTGNWEFEPDINLMYRNYKGKNTNFQMESMSTPYYYADTTTITNNNYKESITTVTPAISINYHDVIAVQGGFEAVLSNSITGTGAREGTVTHVYKPVPKKLSPFLSATWNAIGRNNDQDQFVLRIFGSYAKATSYEMGNMYMVPFGISSVYTNNLQMETADPNTGADLYITSKQWQLGTNISLWKNKLAFSYAYSLNKLSTTISEIDYVSEPPFYIPTAETFYYNYSAKLMMHRFGFDINWKKTEQFSWKTSLNANLVQISYYQPQFTQTDHFATGGIVNRLDSKKTFVGIDILYLFQGEAINGAASMPHYHAFNLQNLYYGKRFKVNGDKTLEVFANVRSMIEDRSPTLLDYRKYYGLGFKLGI